MELTDSSLQYMLDLLDSVKGLLIEETEEIKKVTMVLKKLEDFLVSLNKCPHCHTNIPVNSIFCLKCGKDLSEEVEPFLLDYVLAYETKGEVNIVATFDEKDRAKTRLQEWRRLGKGNHIKVIKRTFEDVTETP